ncbi:MAG: hypothetical protein K0U01_05750 [Betaproteobacteria bacterium]|jgi:hypothetical protein|nr:hypothetical protein [Betaproteobacteria bacterium]|tara:strand:+ start:3306 stop:4010 length:705 start_codon:yes stop_codon:yes gene_type:complete
MLVVRNLYEYQKNMIKFITSSEDYLNEWYNTRAWGILSLRRFRESIDTSINEIQDHEIIEAVRVYDSLRNLQTPNGTTPKDIQTLLKFKKSMIEKGMPERIPPELHSFLNHAEEEIIKGKSPDVAYKYKGEVSGGSGLDETNPPKYIFQITDGLLNSDGASLHKVSKVVEINEYQVTKLTAQQMRKQFREKEMWRLQGYVNWRMEKQIKNKTNDIKWTKGQIKNLKRYWGIEVK